MRILFLSQLLPYPVDAGPKIRSFNVLRHLVAAGHEVTLVSFNRSTDQAGSIEYLNSYCQAIYTVPIRRSQWKDLWYLGRSVLDSKPFLIARDSVKAMRKLLNKLLMSQRFDAIHADQLWMAQYGLLARELLEKHGVNVKLVLDQHNAVFLIPQRLAAEESNSAKRKLLEREARIMKQYEVETCDQFDQVVWVSDDDRTSIGLSIKNRARDMTIPICVDLDCAQVISRPEGSLKVTFLGGLHWPPNKNGILWFIREVWPIVLLEIPNAQLTIIGKDPPEELLDYRGAGLNVVVTGYVDDLMPYLEETAVFIVPLHAGGGMRVKIIDAWSWGLPVVSTTIGAEGIRYQNGENLLIADSKDSFAQAVVCLLKQPKLAEQLGKSGRKRVETEYDWRSRYQAWDQVYSE